MSDLESKVIHTLADRGPLTGAELLAAVGNVDHFMLWRACFKLQTLQITSFASYYIRYDVTRENMLRLSPSILRDFLTFTLIGLPHQRDALHRKQLSLCNRHRDISYKKINIAMMALSELNTIVSEHTLSRICAFVAGDICYFMGHSEERPSAATGKIMNGSDIDIIIVHEEDCDPEDIRKIDEHIMARKVMLMRHPDYRQEIDYVVKPISRLREQLNYVTITEKIACKIVYESLFIWGSNTLYLKLRQMLQDAGVTDQLIEDFNTAIEERSSALKELLDVSAHDVASDVKKLFYATQERVEFI
jgi:hypothetical protein